MTRTALLVLGLATLATAQDPDPAWRSETIAVGAPLNGCAVGDVDPTRPGNEVVAVAQDGSIVVAWRDGDGWKHGLLAKTGGELMQVAVGDLDPEVPGDEVAAVGVSRGREDGDGPGVLVLAWRDGKGWVAHARAHIDGQPAGALLLHAVLIAGREVIFGGTALVGTTVVESVREAGEVQRNGSPGAAQARSAVAARGGVVFTLRDGGVVRARPEAEHELVFDELDRRDAGRARIAAHGDDLLVADDDGLLSLLPAGGSRVEVYRSKDKLRGAVLADLDPDSPGVEAATAGYDGRIVLLRRSGDGWTPAVVAKDAARFHHLAAGELPDRGLSLVGASLGGRLVVASRAAAGR